MKPPLLCRSARRILTIFILALATTLTVDAARLTTARAVLDRFSEAYGSREGWEKISSLRQLGKLYQEGNEFEIVLARKRPNLLRFSLVRDEVKLEFGYDGSQAWLIRHQDGHPVFGSILDDVQAVRIAREANFDWPYFQMMDPTARVGLEGVTQVNERDHYQMNVLTDDAKELDVFVDADTFLVSQVKIVEEGPTDAADDDLEIIDSYTGTVRVLVRLSLEADADIPFPKRLETSLDGTTDNWVEWDSVDVNIGLFNSYFRLPRALEGAEVGEAVDLRQK
ncbi:MAG: hypothetical protein ACFBZ8_13780 [Opitutales bacterium]